MNIKRSIPKTKITDDALKYARMNKLFLYLSEQGCLTLKQIIAITGFTLKEIMALVGEGYLRHRRSYFDDHLLYFPTAKAQAFLKEHGIEVYLPCLRRPPAKNELHDRRLTDLRIAFDKMGYTHWQSERCLNQRGMKRVRPDAILSVGRRKIAIELELSGKGERAYRRRFQFYKDHPAIDAVLYFVGTPELRERLKKLTKDQTKIFVILLRNFTEYKKHAYVEHFRFPGALSLWKFLETIKERRFLLPV